jgi:hypothetical protein
MPTPPDNPSSSAALSLLELRRHLLRRAGTLEARAQGLRDKGAERIAAQVSSESDRLRDVARRMKESSKRD